MSLPSKLIEQRPDVRQAEENLHAASAEVGVAIADMLPQFAINADLGSSALKLGQLFSPYTGFWDAGASLTQTLFDAGALLHKKRAADAALDQAGAQYRAAVILACQNVADTLRALQADADALRASVDAERAARQDLGAGAPAALARHVESGGGDGRGAGVRPGGARGESSASEPIFRYRRAVSVARRRMVESTGGAPL